MTRERLTGGALLDDVFLGGDSWRTVPDDEIWEAARQLVEREEVGGPYLRQLNVSLALALLARRGVTGVRPWELPL